MTGIMLPKNTIEDLMDLPEDTKAELIDGEIYMMAPALARHSLVGAVLTSELISYFKKKRKSAPQGGNGDSWLIISEAWVFYDRHNSFVHDVAGFLDRELPELPAKGPIEVRPSWVCEILSPGN